jgi:hypothetical protein
MPMDSIDISAIKRPDGGAYERPQWMPEAPRQKNETLKPRGLRPPEQLVMVEVIKPHVHGEGTLAAGAVYQTGWGDAWAKQGTGHVRIVKELPAAQGWCTLGAAATAECNQPEVDPHENDGDRLVEVEGLAPGLAGRRIVQEKGERWTDSLREAARSVASGRAWILSELNARDRKFVEAIGRGDHRAIY